MKIRYPLPPTDWYRETVACVTDGSDGICRDYVRCVVTRRRQDIDEALLLHRTSYRRIADHYGLAETSVQRHERNHLTMSLGLSKGLGAMLSGENLLAMLSNWHERMDNQYQKADETNNIMAAVATARTAISAIESAYKIGVAADLEQRVEQLEQAATSSALAIHDQLDTETSTSLDDDDDTNTEDQ